MSRLAVNGFVPGVSVSADDDSGADVASEALRFLRAGGVLRLSDWIAMDAEDRELFEHAGAMLDEERAARVADAFARGISEATADDDILGRA